MESDPTPFLHPSTMRTMAYSRHPLGEYANQMAAQSSWPHDAELTAGQFSEVIIKVAGGCNLACDYCYMYELADQTYKDRPALMHKATVEVTAERLLEYFDQQENRQKPSVIFHGGEPLLQSPGFFWFAVNNIDLLLGDARYSLQTNATRLTREYLDVFNSCNIAVGVSLDGSQVANDRHRLFRNGTSSFKKVEQGMELLGQPAYKHLFSGFLGVIDVRNDPVATYESYRVFDPPSIDFLWPLANHTYKPPFSSDGTTPYGDWLIDVFDHWSEDIVAKRPGTPRIRYFEEIISRFLGGVPTQEVLGVDNLHPSNVVVETDGSLHLVDSLKSTQNGFTDLGTSIWNSHNAFEKAETAANRKIVASGIGRLTTQCVECEFASVCGGGYFPNRYNESDVDKPFNYPSVYHPDLYKLLSHIRRTLFAKTEESGV